MYTYRVRSVYRVVDGDTVDAVIDLGFGITTTIRFRVAGVDTPEMFGREATEAGRDAREFTRHWLTGRRRLVVRTFKGAAATVGVGDGAFGRWLGDFYDDDSGEHLSSALHTAGLTKA